MRKAFGAFLVAGMVLAGVALPGPFGDSGSAQAFCNPGRSGLNGNTSGNFPALQSVAFPNAGGAGPWNATNAGISRSGGVSAVKVNCTTPEGPHTESGPPGPPGPA